MDAVERALADSLKREWLSGASRQCPVGTTLRAHVATALHCKPTRLTDAIPGGLGHRRAAFAPSLAEAARRAAAAEHAKAVFVESVVAGRGDVDAAAAAYDGALRLAGGTPELSAARVDQADATAERDHLEHAPDDATSNPLPNTKRRRVDGAPGGAESRGARPWGRDLPFLPAEDVAIWEFAYEGGAPAVEHRQRRDPGGQLLWAKALADGKFSRHGAAARNDAAGRKMLRNRLAYLKQRRDADPDGFEAALDDACAARDALRDGARPDLSESGRPPAADA